MSASNAVLDAYVEQEFVDNGGKPLSRKVVTSTIFIYPQRVGVTDLNDPKYVARLEQYVSGVRRVVEMTRDYLPGFCVRLYIDESVPALSPHTDTLLASVRSEFPALFERVRTRAVGILRDLREHMAPGETTWLPSVWRFLAFFDALRPADIVHVTDLDAPPFVPFTPDGRRWEAEKRHTLLSSAMSIYVPLFCVVGRALTRHNMNQCASGGILSAQRAHDDSDTDTDSGAPLISPVAWQRMMALVVDAHFRLFLERMSADENAWIERVSASAEFGKLVREIVTGRKNCGDPHLFDDVPEARDALPDAVSHPEAFRKSVDYARVLLLPVCDGTERVPADFRANPAMSGYLWQLPSAGVIQKFYYGVDELIVHALFEFVGPERIFVMQDSESANVALARMPGAATPAAAKRLGRSVATFQKRLPFGRTLNFGEVETLFVEGWLRMMAFSQKAPAMARTMTDAHYTAFAPALEALGVTREGFVNVLTPDLQSREHFSRTAWKRLFQGAEPRDVELHAAWNQLFVRIMTKWLQVWATSPQVDPFRTTGVAALQSRRVSYRVSG